MDATDQRMQRLQSMFTGSISKLSDHLGADFDGILCSEFDQGVVDSFMSGLYSGFDESRKEFEQYMKSGDGGYYYNCLQRAFTSSGFSRERDEKIRILELGCGFGKATNALAKHFPHAEIVATELSPAMLRLLVERMAETEFEGGLIPFQLNAERLNFSRDSMDLIVGSALLHHMMYPEEVIRQCAEILRPGGAAVFFEPFETGHNMLGFLFRQICNDWRFLFLSLAQKRYLKYAWDYWNRMASLPPNDEFFVGKDDKHLFTRSFFERMEKQYNYKSYNIFPLHSVQNSFEYYFRYYMSEPIFDGLPKWVTNRVKAFDSHFTEDAKNDFIFDGGAVLRK